jgi:hypothetical protein
MEFSFIHWCFHSSNLKIVVCGWSFRGLIPQDGGSRFLGNVSIHLYNYTLSQSDLHQASTFCDKLRVFIKDISSKAWETILSFYWPPCVFRQPNYSIKRATCNTTWLNKQFPCVWPSCVEVKVIPMHNKLWIRQWRHIGGEVQFHHSSPWH